MRRNSTPDPWLAAPVHALLATALRRGQTIRLRATSHSMRPTILPGDVLLCRREAWQDGDIVAVRVGANVVTHRVAGTRRNLLELVADNGGARMQVAHGDVLGRVIAIQRPWWRRVRR